MLWFNRKKLAPEANADEFLAQDQGDEDQLIDELTRKEAAVLEAKQPEELSRLIDQHKKDAASYEFSCTRNGHFLSFEITRPYTYGDHKRFSATINLAQVKAVEMREGGDPDREGQLFFQASAERDSNGQFVWGVEGFLGWQFIDDHHAFFEFDENANSGGEPDTASDYGSDIIVDNAARHARDDRIYLGGLGATIYAPHGRGKDVEAALLAAMAHGEERE